LLSVVCILLYYLWPEQFPKNLQLLDFGDAELNGPYSRGENFNGWPCYSQEGHGHGATTKIFLFRRYATSKEWGIYKSAAAFSYGSVSNSNTIVSTNKVDKPQDTIWPDGTGGVYVVKPS